MLLLVEQAFRSSVRAFSRTTSIAATQPCTLRLKREQDRIEPVCPKQVNYMQQQSAPLQSGGVARSGLAATSGGHEAHPNGSKKMKDTTYQSPFAASEVSAENQTSTPSLQHLSNDPSSPAPQVSLCRLSIPSAPSKLCRTV